MLGQRSTEQVSSLVASTLLSKPSTEATSAVICASFPPSESRAAIDGCSTDVSQSATQSEALSSSVGSNAIRDIKCDILANWLYTKQEEKVWTGGEPGEGVFVKRSKDSYAYAPREIVEDGTTLHQSITQLNVRVS